MPTQSEITSEDFETLLSWLDHDRDVAGQRYETIRNRLIRIFYANGHQAAEEIADETMDRVCRKARHLITSFSGDPALFFYGVGKKVLLEYSRKPRSVELPRDLERKTSSDDPETEHTCLDRCLRKIRSDDRSLIVEYYQGEKRDKIERRNRLAKTRNITNEGLRVRAHRIRGSLQKCVENCVAENR
jgi:hypothetical protein